MLLSSFPTYAGPNSSTTGINRGADCAEWPSLSGTSEALPLPSNLIVLETDIYQHLTSTNTRQCFHSKRDLRSCLCNSGPTTLAITLTLVNDDHLLRNKPVSFPVPIHPRIVGTAGLCSADVSPSENLGHSLFDGKLLRAQMAKGRRSSSRNVFREVPLHLSQTDFVNLTAKICLLDYRVGNMQPRPSFTSLSSSKVLKGLP